MDQEQLTAIMPLICSDLIDMITKSRVLLRLMR